ncbi:hypothetical protein J7L00_01285 [Candidatus Bathyarchaeota archaeon]|nr:hypothetical protein [Candidatus Bathyarchaeota archaeon]
MSSTYLIAELKQQQEKLEKTLENLKEQKTKIDEEYLSFKKEEDKIYEEIRRCRDMYQFDKLQMRLNVVATQRKATEQKLSEIEKKIRGYENELKKIKEKINYLKPNG